MKSGSSLIRIHHSSCQLRYLEQMNKSVHAILRVASLLALICALPAHALEVIGVADGDTLTVLDGGKPVKVRLANIDAPERRQPFGERAKLSLSQLCYRQDARLEVTGTDRYGRSIARVSCAGIDANRAQVERGLAWVYVKYNQDARLPALQDDARKGRRGIWSEVRPVPPWEFRKTRP